MLSRVGAWSGEVSESDGVTGQAVAGPKDFRVGPLGFCTRIGVRLADASPTDGAQDTAATPRKAAVYELLFFRLFSLTFSQVPGVTGGYVASCHWGKAI